MTDDKRNKEENAGQLVELISVQGEMNAQVLVSILEAEGIEVMLKSHQTFGALPFTVDGMGEVKLMVRRENLSRARGILKEYRDVADNPELQKMLDDWVPPDTQTH
jgi:hypothetical protein